MRPDRLSCSSASLLMFDLLTFFFLRLVRLIYWLVLEQQRFHGGQSRTIKKMKSGILGYASILHISIRPKYSLKK